MSYSLLSLPNEYPQISVSYCFPAPGKTSSLLRAAGLDPPSSDCFLCIIKQQKNGCVYVCERESVCECEKWGARDVVVKCDVSGAVTEEESVSRASGSLLTQADSKEGVTFTTDKGTKLEKPEE